MVVLRKAWSALLFAAGAGAGCTSKAPPSDVGKAVTSACTADPVPGPSPIRRMTHAEYDNTVRDLLGDATHPSNAFPRDEKVGVFDNDATGQSVTRLLAEGYMTAAEQLAATATASLPEFTGCDPATGEDTCARQFIERWGLRAFRRPLQPDEEQDLFDAFAGGRDEGDFATGLQTVIEVMLQSPEFLYRVELSGAVPSSSPPRLSSWQLASRLSYLFWGTMPDDALFDAARTGQLDSDPAVAVQAQQMLGDPRTRVTFAHFHEQWLGLDKLDHLEKDRAIYPTWSAEIPGLFRAETIEFVDSVMWNGDARVETLLAAPYTFLNAKLALFYGIPDLVAGTAFRRVDLDPSQRAGLLTQGSLLSSLAKFDQSSPVHRGKFVRERLFCTTLQPPPPNIAVRPPALDPRLTTRQRFSQHSVDPFCAGCHALTDPIGLGFENYDGAGLYRATESGQPVDDSGELTGTDVDGVFHGVPELARRLATSRAVANCMALEWFRFAYGRSETPADACTVERLQGAFADSGGDVRKLLLALTETDAFLYRTPEVTP